MIDSVWNKITIEDAVGLADHIECHVAFSNEYYGCFNYADFVDIIKDDISSGDDSHLQGNEWIDEYESNFDDAIGLIKSRIFWLKDVYPFECEGREVRLSVKAGTKNHLVYLFLLACSFHDSFPDLKSSLPVDFEIICKQAMQALFPDWAEVLLFSKHSEDRRKIFGTSASQAVPVLAKKLNAMLKRENEIPDSQNEYGIDIVAICPFDDNLEYPFFAFAQCTVAKEWWRKKHEAIPNSSLLAFVDLQVNSSNFLMIPHFPRKTAEKWSVSPDRVTDCVLCDRYRICWLLEKSNLFKEKKLPTDIHEIFQTIQEYLLSESH